MRKFIFFLLLHSLPFGLLYGQHIYPSLSGDELLDAVVTDYKPLYVLDYGEARDVMYGEIYNENDSVQCVYSGHTLYLPPSVDPSTHLYMSGSTNGINAEHTYPQSKGADEDNGNPHSDLHHIFPVRAGVNTARGNSPFVEISDNQTVAWYYKTLISNDIPTENKNAYSERKNNQFEPREDFKGNVARAIFYFYTMYKADALEADPLFFEVQRETLCDWHLVDVADDLEVDRTYQIAGYQDGLPNPFVTDATLAFRSYCTHLTVSVSDEPEVIEPIISIFPNPVTDFLTVKISGEQDLLLTDILGRKLKSISFINQVEIDFSSFAKGAYFLHLKGGTYKVIK